MSFNLYTERAVSRLMKALIAKVVTPVVEGITKMKKVYPQMATSSQEDINLHNINVQTRQVSRKTHRDNVKLSKV